MFVSCGRRCTVIRTSHDLNEVETGARLDHQALTDLRPAAISLADTASFYITSMLPQLHVCVCVKAADECVITHLPSG